MEENYSIEGSQNLKTADEAKNFVNWMYSILKPYIRGTILEVGSGIGTYSEKIVKDFKDNRIFLSDIDRKYVAQLRDRFASNKNIYCVKLNLNEPADFKNIDGAVDTVIASNVLEHVENDVSALNNIYEILNKNGKFVILVPAHKVLYNCIDKAIGHYRRYTKKEIYQKVAQTQFTIKSIFYFNFLAIFGWYLQGNVLKKTVVDSGKIKLFDALVPFMRFLEKYIMMRKIGIPLIVILEKE